MVEILVNGQALELDDLTKIKYTAQISDIFDIAKVKASHTNSFSVPKTYNNVRIFEGLGLVGSSSQVPYNKIPVTLKENGFDVVSNGWLNVVETTDKYKINIIDGIIDFFKAIENYSIGDLDLSEINHEKTLDAVINSFSPESFYKYIVSDYGGGQSVIPTDINIDYLVPSAKYSYLMDKIFSFFGFTKSGSVFSNEDYLDFWLTYPKEAKDEDTVLEQIAHLYNGQKVLTPSSIHNGGFLYTNEWVYTDPTTNPPINGNQYIIPENNYYELIVNAKGYTKEFSGYSQNSFYLWVRVNGQISGTPLLVFNNQNYQTIRTGPLQEGDVIDFVFYAPYPAIHHNTQLHLDYLEVYLHKSQAFNVDFSDALKDLKITDFFNDFLRRFALTPVIDTNNNHITFYTLNERLNKAQALDWSEKFVRRTKESYLFGSYAQRNSYNHKYNGDNEDFNNGELLVDNKNLQLTKDLATSFVYSAEKTPVKLGSLGVNVFPTLIWEKEVQQDSEGISVNYKGLTGRFYILKQEPQNITVRFYSEITGDSEEYTTPPFANFKDVHYSELIPKYYKSYTALINNCKVHDFEMELGLIDRIKPFHIFPIYIESEASYYLLNKVTFETDKPSKVEAIKINFDIETTNYENILSYSDGCFNITNFEPGEFFFQFSYNDGATWQTGSISIMENPSCGFSTLNPVLFRLVDGTGNVVSNTIQINP